MLIYNPTTGWKKVITEGIMGDFKYNVRSLLGGFSKCIYCKRPINDRTDSFMVNDTTWRTAFPNSNKGKEGFIHWNCLETLLKRPLSKEDFSQYINYAINKLNPRVQKVSGIQPPTREELDKISAQMRG